MLHVVATTLTCSISGINATTVLTLLQIFLLCMFNYLTYIISQIQNSTMLFDFAGLIFHGVIGETLKNLIRSLGNVYVHVHPDAVASMLFFYLFSLFILLLDMMDIGQEGYTYFYHYGTQSLYEKAKRYFMVILQFLIINFKDI